MCKEQTRQSDRHTQNTNNTNDPQKKSRLETVSKVITGGFKQVGGTNLSLISDADKDI